MDFQGVLQSNLDSFQQHWPQAAKLLQTFFANHKIKIQTDGVNVKLRFLHNHSDAYVEMIAPIQPDLSLNTYRQYEQFKPERQWLILMGASAVSPDFFVLRPQDNSTPVVIVEPDVAVLAAYCCIRSFAALVSCKQFHGFLGPSALREFQQTLVDRLHPFFLAKPNIHFIPGTEYARPTEEESQRLQTVQKMVMHEREVLLKKAEAAQQRYHNQQNKKTKKVFLVIPSVSCWRNICDGLAEGFEKNGIEVFKFYHLFPPSNVTPLDSLRLTAVFYKQQPDLIITLSHASDLFIQGIESMPVKRLVWYIDEPNHLIHKPHGRFDYLVPVWKEFNATLEQRGGTLLDEVPIGCGAIQSSHQNDLECEVGFVGSIVDTIDIQKALPDEIRQKVQAIVNEKLADCSRVYSELLSRFGLDEKDIQIITQVVQPILRTAGMTDASLLEFYLNVECNRIRRISVLSALHEFDLKIYGNPEWQRLLQDTPIAHCYQGKGLTSQECYDFYCSAKISINIHPCFAHSGPNTRDFDIPMCGGFLLSDIGIHAKERMAEFYNAENEIALFDEPESAADAVRRYLQHPDQRQRMIEAAQQRTSRDHSYAARAKQMMVFLRCTET
ncbi:MAG: glycosyltransferase [Candidatus Hinthialibacter antarcticus]|nr:glycosyltransferase [Candidatus Hinthialibacter antarcticus]